MGACGGAPKSCRTRLVGVHRSGQALVNEEQQLQSLLKRRKATDAARAAQTVVLIYVAGAFGTTLDRAYFSRLL